VNQGRPDAGRDPRESLADAAAGRGEVEPLAFEGSFGQIWHNDGSWRLWRDITVDRQRVSRCRTRTAHWDPWPADADMTSRRG